MLIKFHINSFLIVWRNKPTRAVAPHTNTHTHTHTHTHTIRRL